MELRKQPFWHHAGTAVELYRDDQWVCIITTRRRYPFLPFRWETEFYCLNDVRFFAAGGDLKDTLGRFFYRSSLSSRSIREAHNRVVDRVSQLGDSGIGLQESIAKAVRELFAEGVIARIVELKSWNPPGT
jgi:hypothetical protein